jgi:hypothetical protein
MSYTAADARQQLLDELARATDHIAAALAALGEAYEQMEEHAGDRLEQELFRPVQAAYGRAQRAHAGFAGRYSLPTRSFDVPGARLPTDPRHGIEFASEELRGADETLATLQDSMLPVEVGDPEIRADISHVRELIGPLPTRAREIVRVLGR